MNKGDLQQIGELIDGRLDEKLKPINKTLKNHDYTLTSITKTLDSHTRVITSIARTLGDHSRLLEAHQRSLVVIESQVRILPDIASYGCRSYRKVV